MKLFASLLVLMIGFRLFNGPREFVCLPCGLECDNQVFNSAGSCPSCNMKLIEKSTIRFSNISVGELCDKASKPNVILLDVRSPEEFNGTAEGMSTFGHFKNAINVNVTDLENRLKELDQYKTKDILVYCSHAHRSAVASYFLTTHGFSSVKNMTGGVSTINPQQTDCLQKFFVRHSH